jgi:hypothetical protein
VNCRSFLTSAKPLGVSRTRFDSFHVTHKVPVGDSPYIRPKNVQASFYAFLKLVENRIFLCFISAEFVIVPLWDLIFFASSPKI